MKTINIGGQLRVLPLRANGLWVEDARGHNVCECINYEVARWLAATLNATHPIKQES